VPNSVITYRHIVFNDEN